MSTFQLSKAILEDGLEVLVDAFFDNSIESPAPSNAVLVGRVEHQDSLPITTHPRNVTLFCWAKDLEPIVNPHVSMEELRACRWSNHLDTLIEQTSRFSASMEVIYAALECARRGRTAYIEESPSVYSIWFA